jgi:ABC-type sugar transport system ATPase subunit
VRLVASSIRKAFGPTQAVSSASLELHGGEVLAVIGENGSGKSTLVKILAGVHQPDRGGLEIDSQSVRFVSPRDALRKGIVAVFQEVLVADSRSVLDNAWLGVDGLFRGRIGEAQRRVRAQGAFSQLLDHVLHLDQPVEQLSISDRQACCIVRAFLRSPRILLLDEATSSLDVATRARLFTMIRNLTASGSCVVFISHRLDEVEEIADRIVVMRAGETVADRARAETSRPELVRLMSGAEREAERQVGRAVAARAPGRPVLEVHGVKLRPEARLIDFTLRSGELVGLAGLEGHGQEDFLNVLRGAAGEMVVHTDKGVVRIASPHEAERRGIAYVPRDRAVDGVFETLSIRDNFALPTLRRDTRFGLLDRSSTERRLREYIGRLKIRLHTPADPIAVLSGGNQQKVVIARWLAAQPRVLLLNDPTRGVDVGTKQDIYRLLAELTEQGVAVVLLSTEVDELVELMERVLVFREHELSAELPREALTPSRLVAAFFGQEHAHASV